MRHLRTFLLLAGVLSCGSLYPQTFDLDLQATMLRNTGGIKKGTEVTLSSFTHETVIDNGFLSELFYIEDSDGSRIEVSKKLDDTFDFHYKNIQDFWDASIITNVLYNLKKNGFQYEFRKDRENIALDYIQKVKENNLEFNDPYLENYIYSLTAKIAPVRLIDGRPSNINILIQQNPAIQACTYPNGTIVLNTGLLSILHSEDELVAILAHEIAHFVLDHSVINENKANQRIKRAEFWTGLLTGVAAAAEGVAASRHERYYPGAATVGVAALSSTIAARVVSRLGMEYNHEQESEADQIAIQVLDFLGYDKNAMATALFRIEKEYLAERNNAVFVSSYTHPDLLSRIMACGVPNDSRDLSFEQKVSFAVTNLAAMKYEDRRFSQCVSLVSQNIGNRIGTSDDYILKASCLLALNNTPESNEEVLQLINRAKATNTGSMINVYTTEIVANLRLNRKAEAVTLLNEYITQLSLLMKETETYESDRAWESTRLYADRETDWARRMLVKLQGMN